MEKNKTGKYLKYAIGEIILVVIGILIALSINNWNESRKLEQKKQELILNLIADFEENITQLESAIVYSNSLSDKMDAFFENAYKPNLKIPLDSLKALSDGFFRPSSFFPSMATYDEAKSSGNLTLLKNKDLSKQFIQFQRNYSFYLGLQDQGTNSFFSGPEWELKKEIGSLSILTGRKKDYIKIDYDMDSYMKLINMPIVTGTLENRHLLNSNTNFALTSMDFNSKKIVEILNELKKCRVGKGESHP